MVEIVCIAPDAAELEEPLSTRTRARRAQRDNVTFPITVFRRRADRFFMAAADRQGRFQIDGMPPGGYRLFAWDDVEREAWFDPEFVRTLESGGRPVKIEAKSAASVKLRMIR